MEKTSSKTNQESTMALPEELIDSRELAKRMSVSTKTISNWQSDKVIPFYKIIKTVRFNWLEVIAALDTYKQSTTA